MSARVMRECDALAVARRGQESLVNSAGLQVALVAQAMLGSLYARRICALVGPGLNGNDGRAAAAQLRSRGSRVDVVDVAHQPSHLHGYDLVIDSAFGLGCSRPYVAPTVAGGTLVLAVDLPSGVDADTGDLLGRPLRASITLALGALKPAHVDGDAAQYAGELRFADLGILVPANDGLITDDDLRGFVTAHSDDHKWTHALAVLAGNTRMPGAAALVCAGALSAGASMVLLESRGKRSVLTSLPWEVVRAPGAALDPRVRCVVAGPGLGVGSDGWLEERLDGITVPTVFDADALSPPTVSLKRHAPRILTPHAGEFARLSGAPLGSRRIEKVRQLASAWQCVVLLKGPRTIIAEPNGRVRVVNSGTAALATAGTGDVLAGMIGAAIARGLDVGDAVALSAHLHGRAGSILSPYQSSSALPAAVRRVLAALV